MANISTTEWNVQDSRGNTLLHRVAKRASIEENASYLNTVIRVLLNRGVNPLVKNKEKKCAFEYLDPNDQNRVLIEQTVKGMLGNHTHTLCVIFIQKTYVTVMFFYVRPHIDCVYIHVYMHCFIRMNFDFHFSCTCHLFTFSVNVVVIYLL